VATEGLRLIPARIQDGKIHLMCGTSKVSNDGFPEGPQYAAWLPRYSGSDKNTSRALTYPDGGLPQHGDEVECQVELIQHCRWDQQKETHVADFQYWRVQAIARAGNVLPSVSPAEAGSRRPGRSWHQPTGETRNIHGWVCITNANINRKYHERVFFREGTPPGPFPLTDTIRKQWVHLIENYQRIHEEDLNKRQKRSQEPDQYLGPEPGQTAWSRHVYRKEDRELEDGTLCYALLRNDNSAVEALFPVMIARRLYPATPWDLLHESLRPASTILDLSPADRVFGWVKGDSDSQGEERRTPTAARGLLRIGPVTCDSSPEEAVETFLGAGLPLAILAAPKLQQGRFYVAAYCQGEAQPDGLSKVDAGYSSGKGLRGRKVYPHHRSLPEDHWVNPLEDRTQNEQGPWQEYRRPRKDEREQRDDQNRSFLGWIKPGARFRFDIHVTNLSEVELGALLYLLKLPEGHYHRFGGGKPLGFGSVRLSVAESELRTGEVLRERYRAWSIRQSAEDICENALAAFKQAVFRAYGPATGAKSFEQVPFIRAFLKTCTGFEDGLLVHYPRVTRKPSPDGESFKWFVANEKKGSNTRRALPNLVNDAGLPIFPDPTRRGERRR